MKTLSAGDTVIILIIALFATSVLFIFILFSVTGQNDNHPRTVTGQNAVTGQNDNYPRDWSDRRIGFEFAHPKIQADWKFISWEHNDGNFNTEKTGAFYQTQSGSPIFVDFVEGR